MSVELLSRPELVGKPVIVGGSPNSRGVVCSASYEARKFGVRSAMPCFKAHKLCPQAVFISQGMSDYGFYSQKIKEVFLEFTPLVEMASLDEAYLDLRGTEKLWGNALQAVEKIRERIKEQTNLPCSFGIGRNKLVAKISSDMGKPNGLFWVPLGLEKDFLGSLELKKIPGIGKETISKLNRITIRKVSDLTELSAVEARQILGPHGAELRERCLGDFDSTVSPQRSIKSVSHERTFDQDIDDEEKLLKTISWLCEKTASRLRVKKKQAYTVTVKLKTADFKIRTISQTLSFATDSDQLILKTAKELFLKKWNSKDSLRLLGVGCSNLIAQDQEIQLFAEEEGLENEKRLNSAVDALREKYGFDSLGRASSVSPRKNKQDVNEL